MKNALVVGMNKTGTTIVASVIWNSIAPAHLEMEPLKVAFFEKRGNAYTRLVVKILYEHWMQRHFLLTGIVRGETEVWTMGMHVLGLREVVMQRADI